MQLSREQLEQAYRRMKIIREFEERLHVEIGKGEIPGFTHLYAGQEACAVGVCENLTDDDLIVSTHRGHGHCIAKGCDVKGMMKEIYGKSGGICGGKGGSMHIADLDVGMLGANGIVGGGPPLAVGAAIATRNQGTVFEAMNLAVVLKVPTIFVFENNGYSEHTAFEYAVGSGDIAGRAEAFGMPAIKADGADFFSVYDATKQAVERARKGEGPATLEFAICRFYGHVEGDPQNYRGPDEVKNLRETMDCLKNFRTRVSEAKLLELGRLDEIDEEVMKLIEEAVDEAREAPPPAPEALYTDVYNAY